MHYSLSLNNCDKKQNKCMLKTLSKYIVPVHIVSGDTLILHPLRKLAIELKLGPA